MTQHGNPVEAGAGAPVGAPAPASVTVAAVKKPRRKPKAGRDLSKAIPVGLALIAILVLSLVFDTRFFAILVLVLMFAAQWELARALKVRNIHVPLVPLWVGSALIVMGTWLKGPGGLLFTFLFTCGLVCLWRAVRGRGGGPLAVRDALAGVFMATYVSLLGAFTLLLAVQEQGAILVFLAILIGVANDTGGYVAGVLFGKHPMAPMISPKKSWEGFVGSQLLAAGIGAAVMHFALGESALVGVVIGMLGSVASTVGDFSESLIKRDLGIKDMSNLIPGHGGVLDRLDSLLVCAPVTYAVLLVLSDSAVL